MRWLAWVLTLCLLFVTVSAAPANSAAVGRDGASLPRSTLEQVRTALRQAALAKETDAAAAAFIPPREVAGTLTGTWSGGDGDGERSVDGNVSLPLGATNATVSVPRSAVHQLGLRERGGFALVSLLQKWAPSLVDRNVIAPAASGARAADGRIQAIDVLYGDVLLRDGPYRSVRDRAYRVLGLYSWQEARVVLFGDFRLAPHHVLQRLYEMYQGMAGARIDGPQACSFAEFEREVAAALRSPVPALVTDAALEAHDASRPPPPSSAAAASAYYEETLGGGWEQHHHEHHHGRGGDDGADNSEWHRKSAAATDDPQVEWPWRASNSTGWAAGGVVAAIPPAAFCPVRLELTVVPLNGSGAAARNPPVVTLSQSSTHPWGARRAQRREFRFAGTVGTSPECRGPTPLQLQVSTVATRHFLSEAQRYTLATVLMSFLQVVAMVKQMEATNTQASASKVSMLTIGVQAIMDAYLCLMHLVMGVAVQAVFNAFATAAFFQFVIFSIFEMRYLLMIWKARSVRASNGPGAGGGWDAVRRELSLLYSRFYAGLLLGVLAIYQLQNYLFVLLLLMHAYWVPQVVRNAVLDARRSLLPLYVWLISATRLFPPLYFLLYPGNFLHLRPQPLLAGILSGWCALQVLLLESQRKYGGRWFIPKRFLPAKYDYYRPFAVPASTDCVICMSELEQSQVYGAPMVAPCDHAFHTECLLQWMEIKMECPTCRRALPAP